jgi:hypothetical protein
VFPSIVIICLFAIRVPPQFKRADKHTLTALYRATFTVTTGLFTVSLASSAVIV